tara:strand:+ start:234 stop:617 length:384 start_codon:yes stop_codon:yes gene_type:complete
MYKDAYFYEFQNRFVNNITNFKLKNKSIEAEHEVKDFFHMLSAYVMFMFEVRDEYEIEINREEILSRFNIVQILEDLKRYKKINPDFSEKLIEKLQYFPEYYSENKKETEFSKEKFLSYRKFFNLVP